MNRSIAAVGDVTDPRCWSGTPFHFWKSAMSAGFAQQAWRVDLDQVRMQRLLWNAARVLRFRKTGGFQYSRHFLDLIESRIPDSLWTEEVITMNQHFPRAKSVESRGGRLHHYLDAPFSALATGRGLALDLPDAVVKEAIALERENYGASKRIVTMARWAADAIRSEVDLPSEKIHVILPGANLDLPEGWDFATPQRRPGKERDFTLGFIGKDWERKGLPLLLEVGRELMRRGWRVRVLVVGEAPAGIQKAPGIEFAGFINKSTHRDTFLDLLTQCDVGCLFSEREALGISTLEFLRAGVPVAGFAHEGTADTIPPDAGFRFAPATGPGAICDQFEAYLADESRQADFRAKARQWSSLVTWDRCAAEFRELWATGTVRHPVQPWRGLEAQHA